MNGEKMAMHKKGKDKVEFDNIIRDIKEKVGQLIAIPDGYVDEVIVRFGEGGRRQQKILYKGMFLSSEEIEDIFSFAFDQIHQIVLKDCIKMLQKKLKLKGSNNRKEIKMTFDEILKLIMKLKKQIERTEEDED